MEAFEPGLSLIVGAPRHALSELLVERIIAEGRPLVALVPPRDLAPSRALLRRFERAGAAAQLLVGDPTSIDLGLSGPEYLALARGVREVHHLLPVGASRMGEGDPSRAVRELLQLGEAARSLERISFWSSVLASGKRSGILREEPFSRIGSQATEDLSVELHRADALASDAIGRLPITILRTGTLVLGPRPAADEPLDAARLLVLFLLSRGREPFFVMPGRADGVLSFVPAEHAAKAGLAIVRDDRSAHGIFHVVDSDPPTVRRAISILCGLTGREAPRLFVPSRAASALLRAPGLAHRMQQLRALLDELGSSLHVSDAEARAILEPAGIVCPAFESYAERLVDEVREQVDDARRAAGSVERYV